MNAESRNALATRTVLLLLCFAASAIFAALIPLLWHDKLYIDGLTIVHTPPLLEAFGSSFESSAFFLNPILDLLRGMGVGLDNYGLLYDNDLLIVNNTFGALFCIGIAILAVRWRIQVNLKNILIFSVFVVLFAPFYFCITKELVLFAATLVVLSCYRAGWFGLSTMVTFYVILLILCGIYFRVYYLAFAILLVFNFLFWRKRKWLSFFYVIAAVMLVVLHDHLPLDLLNKGRATYLENVSASRIEYYFDDGSGAGFLANRALTFCMLLLPINLLAVSVSYAPFIVAQAFLSLKMLRQLMRPGRDISVLAASAVMAFTMVAALFEPDFGSYFRHKVGILLFMLLLIADFEWCKQRGQA